MNNHKNVKILSSELNEDGKNARCVGDFSNAFSGITIFLMCLKISDKSNNLYFDINL